VKIIRYFFYRIYSFSLSNGENDAGWAMVIVSMFTLANVYSFFDIIILSTNSSLPEIEKPAILIFCSVVLYFNYVVLMKNGKSKIILKEFNEMNGSKSMLNLLLMLYIVGSIVLFIFTGNMVRDLN
jgi:hypothetical protein